MSESLSLKKPGSSEAYGMTVRTEFIKFSYNQCIIRTGGIHDMASEKLRSIRRWLFLNARALDVARWNYHFEDGSVKEILKALAAYQNLDGGFAHGLEPDLRTSTSNPMSTWTATRLLREAGLPQLAGHMIDKILDYLEGTLTEYEKWPATTPAHEEGPHAPWFSYDPDDVYWGWNPTIELAAFVLQTGSHHRELYETAERIIRQALLEIMDPEYLPAANELSNITEATAILITIRPDLLPEGLVPHVEGLIQRLVNDDRSAYETLEYILTPDFVLNSPESPWYPAIHETCDFYAHHLEASVTEHGYWDLRWDWGDAELHPDSLRDWRGSLLVDHMLYLQNFKPEES